MLVSLVLLIGFQSVGWAPVFDLGIQWQHIWMLVGVLGSCWLGQVRETEKASLYFTGF